VAPPSPYVRIDPEVLRRLYVDERLTTDAIAAQLSCASITILRRLRTLGIPVRPRGPSPGDDLRCPGTDPLLRTTWSRDIAYVVGLIATDGNLSKNRRTVSVSSKDSTCSKPCNGVCACRTGSLHTQVATAITFQWNDRPFYDWLLGLGLTPAKSLTLGPLAVPDEHFADFFRGCVCRLVGVSGALQSTRSGKRQRPLWLLRYAKAESI
jgi:hypothetical protein